MSSNTVTISKEHHPNPKSLMLHGMGFVTGDPAVWINYPFVFHPGVKSRLPDKEKPSGYTCCLSARAIS